MTLVWILGAHLVLCRSAPREGVVWHCQVVFVSRLVVCFLPVPLHLLLRLLPLLLRACSWVSLRSCRLVQLFSVVSRIRASVRLTKEVFEQRGGNQGVRASLPLDPISWVTGSHAVGVVSSGAASRSWSWSVWRGDTFYACGDVEHCGCASWTCMV